MGAPLRGTGLTRRQLLRGAAAAGGAAALLPALSACGAGAASAALTADAAGSLQGATIRAMVNQPHTTAFTELLAPAFAEQFGGDLQVTAVPYDQLTSKQVLDVQGGAGEFDVFDYFYFGLGALVDADALVDLTDWIPGADVDPDDFLPSVYDPYTLLDDRRYGLPFDGDVHVLFYNTEVFERYGVSAPTTWDEYDETAAKITRDSGGSVHGAVVQGQQVPMILGCSFINRLAGHGGTLVDADGNPTLTSDAAVAALRGLVDVSPHVLPTPLQIGFDQSNAAFLSGQAAMLDTWTDLGLRAQDPANSSIVDRWGAVALPVGGSNTEHRTALNAGFGLGVSTAAADTAVAAAFVAWATGTANNLLLASTAGAGIDPARTSALASDGYAQVMGVEYPVVQEGLEGDPLVWPKDATAPQRLQDLVDQLALALAGDAEVEEALEAAQASWEATTA